MTHTQQFENHDRVGENSKQNNSNDGFDRRDLYSGLPDIGNHSDSKHSVSADGKYLHCGSHHDLYGGHHKHGDDSAHAATGGEAAAMKDLMKMYADMATGDFSAAFNDFMHVFKDIVGSELSPQKANAADSNSCENVSKASDSSSTPADTSASTSASDNSSTASDTSASATTPGDSTFTNASNTASDASTTNNNSNGGDSATNASASSDTTVPASSDTSAPAGDAAAISLSQVNDQQDASKNTVLPGGGVQDYGYGWAKGATQGWPNPEMPSNANDSVAWLDAYPENGTAEKQGDNITVKNMNEYALLKDGTWQKLGDPNAVNDAWSQTNPNSMQGITDYAPKLTFNNDGSFSIATAPDGQVQQWGAAGGTFDTSQIVGIYASAEVKADDNDSNTVVQLGADYYNTTASNNGAAGGDMTYLQGIGTSNWVRLSDQYQPISLTTLDAATLAKNPPPGVTGF